jgi:hypothetical protein
MSQLVTLPSKNEAVRILNEHGDVVQPNDIRQTVRNSLAKLNDVEKRIEKIEGKGFFSRFVGTFTGSNDRDMVAAMRDMTQVQQMTIQLVLSLAIMHAQNQQALEDILDELGQAKGLHTRAAEHISFLYNQVEMVKVAEEQRRAEAAQRKRKSATYIIAGAAAAVMLVVVSWVLF